MAESSKATEDERRKCQICSALSKYRCPRCFTRTCSLNCVKTHKTRMSCDGIRNKTAYVKLDKFTDLDLLSDYRFLEEAARVTDNAFRDKRKRLGRSFGTCKLPYWLHKLQVEAHLRGTMLRFLPLTFEKRKINSSIYLWRERLIYWRIEWIFPQADLKHVDERVCENSTVVDALQKHLDVRTLNSEIQQRMASYLGNGMNGLCVLMKAENRPANSPCYHEMDLSLSIKDNLRDKVIIEYPTLFVVPKHHIVSYPLVGDEHTQSTDTLETDTSELEEGEVTEDNREQVI